MWALPKDPILQKFINYVLKEWKKSVAIRLLEDTFDEIKSKWQKNPMSIFTKAFENVTPRIEVRPKRVGWSIYQVPQEVKPNRQLFLVAKWILNSARSRKGIDFSKALAIELIDAANETWNAVRKKEEVYKMAEANKAFARFARR